MTGTTLPFFHCVKQQYEPEYIRFCPHCVVPGKTDHAIERKLKDKYGEKLLITIRATRNCTDHCKASQFLNWTALN